MTMTVIAVVASTIPKAIWGRFQVVHTQRAPGQTGALGFLEERICTNAKSTAGIA